MRSGKIVKIPPYIKKGPRSEVGDLRPGTAKKFLENYYKNLQSAKNEPKSNDD